MKGLNYMKVCKKLAAVLAVTLMTLASCSSVPNVNNSSQSGSEVVSQAEKKEDTVITMAINTNVSNIIKDEIDSFNSADNGYRIVIKCYDSEFYDETINNVVLNEGDDLTIDFNLIQDIINTDDIDIIASSAFGNEAKYEILKNKGAFVDLYPFMENDSEVNTSTLNQHILSISENDGKLYSMPVYYNLQTLIGQKKYVGDKENWTVDDFISHWEQMPEGSTIDTAVNSENVYYTILRANLESFVDYENAEVHFDSPEFKKILEFCNRFPSNNGQKGECDYESPIFVEQRIFSGIMSAKWFCETSDDTEPEALNTSFDAPYTMVGFPSSDGEGAFFFDSSGIGRYSISAKSSSEKQEGAWQFIRTLYTEEFQTSHVIKEYQENYNGQQLTNYSDELGFCINNNAFEQITQKIINGEYYDGKSSYRDEEYTYSLPTQEEVDKLVTYLNSIDKWEATLDKSLREIVNDEVMEYLSGQKTLDETVDMIQNRASTWVSEQN
jgi:ABC-type glycerol-3-phosphate transport system substrate-binding protein